MTCWRRLQRWTDAGVFDQVHQILLAKLNAANRIDWSRAAMDGSHIDAKKWGAGTGPSPVNRGRPGSKHHLICDGNGTPIYVLTSGANVPDISRALALLDGYPPIAGRRAGHDAGSPRCWPTRPTAAKPSARPAASAAPSRSSRSPRRPA
jgi:Transposase DDE domain